MDTVIYNHMPAWIFANKDLSFSAKLIMERIYSLSKDGLQHVFVKRADFAKLFGASIKTISRGFKELLNLGLIKEELNPNKWDQVRYFSVTQKAMEQTAQNVPNGEVTGVPKCPSQERLNSQTGVPKSPSVLLDRSIGRYECDLYKKETSKVTEEETKEWLSIPPVSEEELEPESQQVMEVKDTHPLIINSLSKTSVKEKSSAKREKNNKFTVPSYAEVVALITNWARVHMAKYPQLGRLDCALEAENFISYWESCGWKRKGQTIKSLNGTIATWLINALKYGNITVKSYNPAQDYRKTGLTREMNQEIAEMVVPKAKQYMEYLDKCEKGEEVHIKHRDEFEDLPLLTGRY